MKILLVGVHNKYFANTVEFREKAIKDLEHELVFFDDRKFCIPGRIRRKIKGLHRWDLLRINKALVSSVKKMKPELCLILGGQRILRSTVLALKELGVPTALWTSDVPLDFDNVISSAIYYDNIFCAGSEAIELLSSKGIKGMNWLPFACDPELHHPVELSPDEIARYSNDIVFVGSYYPNRAKIMEILGELDIKIYGPGWGRVSNGSKLKNKIIDRRIDCAEWIKIFSAAKIVLTVHYQDGKTPCYQASPKLFEALACKRFVLCDYQKDVRELFENKNQLVFFENNEDLRRKVLYYLKNEEERDNIALNGYTEVIAKHTYRHRIKEILKYVK